LVVGLYKVVCVVNDNLKAREIGSSINMQIHISPFGGFGMH